MSQSPFWHVYLQVLNTWDQKKFSEIKMNKWIIASCCSNWQYGITRFFCFNLIGQTISADVKDDITGSRSLLTMSGCSVVGGAQVLTRSCSPLIHLIDDGGMLSIKQLSLCAHWQDRVWVPSQIFRRPGGKKNGSVVTFVSEADRCQASVARGTKEKSSPSSSQNSKY